MLEGNKEVVNVKMSPNAECLKMFHTFGSYKGKNWSVDAGFTFFNILHAGPAGADFQSSSNICQNKEK